MTEAVRDQILITDDDPAGLEVLYDLFADDYEVLRAQSGPEAISAVRQSPGIVVVVMDIKMPKMDGITAARQISNLRPDIAIIFHTGYPGEYDEHTIDKQEKPYDYVQKGVSGHQLIRSVRHAVEAHRLRRDVKRLSEIAESSFRMIGHSPIMTEVFQLIQRVGPSSAKVMILGETGTGKELAARALHALSPRREQRLAIFNCNHKSPDLVESELFGHMKGAFTGALADRIGLFEYADKGTVLLDEIGDLDITTQAKLLRVLETGEYQRIGSPRIQKCDVRLLCATHRDLAEMVAQGKFRQDLFYRLRGIVINLPALRDRREDIPLLVNSFLDRFTVQRDMPPKLIDPTAMDVLVSQDWPGNIRQLLDKIESLVVLTDSHLITRQDVERQLGITASPDAAGPSSVSTLPERLRAFKRDCIVEALAQAENNVSQAARILGVDRANLRREIKELGIPLS